MWFFGLCWTLSHFAAFPHLHPVAKGPSPFLPFSAPEIELQRPPDHQFKSCLPCQLPCIDTLRFLPCALIYSIIYLFFIFSDLGWAYFSDCSFRSAFGPLVVFSLLSSQQFFFFFAHDKAFQWGSSWGRDVRDCALWFVKFCLFTNSYFEVSVFSVFVILRTWLLYRFTFYFRFCVVWGGKIGRHGARQLPFFADTQKCLWSLSKNFNINLVWLLSILFFILSFSFSLFSTLWDFGGGNNILLLKV